MKENKNNVLFVITKSENGGAQKWTKEQIEISSNLFQCFLATDENGWLSQNINVKNTLYNHLIYKRFSLKYLFMLSKFVKENNIDLIVASSANAGLYSRLLKLLNKKIKVIYVTHGWSSIYNGGKLKFLFTFIEKQLSKIGNSVLCISEKDAENAKKIIKIEKNKLKCIVNKIYPMPMENNINVKIKILTVARLAPPKRVDLLIKAMSNLDIELHIIGDGVLKDGLVSLSNSKTFFHGEIDNFNEFSQYDIFALISDSEGLPLSALEAMSVGMPLILSDVGGCSELIDNNGILVKNNISDIVNAINICIVNYKQFSNNSQNIFDKKFNLEKNKEEYLNYYTTILGD